VADIFANPLVLPGNRGALFRLDAETGAVVDTIQMEEMADPTDLEWLPDGRILITDGSANPYNLPPPTGVLFALDLAAREMELFAFSPLFVQPQRSRMTPDGRILVVDRSARVPGGQAFRGGVLQVEVETGQVSYYAGSDDFSVLRSQMIVPFPAAQIETFSFEDENLSPLEPGDRLTYHVGLLNAGQLDEVQALFVDTLPPELALLPETLEADLGVFSIEGPVLTWTGSIDAGERVDISYEALLNPIASQGAHIVRRVYVSGLKSRAVGASLEHVVATTLDPGTMYVVDFDADPWGLGIRRGGLFKVTFPLGAISTVASSEQWLTPVDVELLSPVDRTFIVLDSDADPLAAGRGGGALFIADATDGSVSLLAADSTWVEPSQVIRESDESFLVLDAVANPYRLGGTISGPGAIYRVTVPEGEVEIVYSDTILSRPTGMALDGVGGLYIADVNADPWNLDWRKGAIFLLDLASKDIEVIAVSPLFEDPMRVVVLPTGELLVLDATTRPEQGVTRGAVLWVEGSEVRLHSRSGDFLSLRDLFTDGNASVFVVDRDADPLGYGDAPGGVFRYNATRRSYRALASGPQFANPSGAFVYDAMTPVFLKSFDAQPTENGAVLLTWDVTADVEPTGYLVLRRPLDEETSYEVLNPADPVRGSGPFSFRDETVEPGRSYSYMLTAIQSDGGFVYLGPVPVDVPRLELRFALERPSPNPFGNTTVFRFSVPTRQKAKLVIYDLQGRVVRSLAGGVHEPGVHTVVWDGKNQSRHPVATGVYFAKFEGEGGEKTRRVVVLR
jgi:uncharacterized repeat protein (TIGR01451 family)